MTDDLEQTTIVPGDQYEPAGEAAPAAMVVPPQANATGGRLRWVVAAGVVMLVVLATAFAISLFTGRAANATVLGYVPNDSIMYGEIRMDLPGDQRANVAGFLSKFPGFADQSTIETKIDEIFDRMVGGATDGDQAYSSDLKPWFGGELAFSVGALPDPSTLQAAPEGSGMDGARFLALASVKDPVIARAWFDEAVAGTGSSASTETYSGADLSVIDGKGAYAILDGKVAVIGDLASVKAAVDTKGAGAFAATPDLKTALDATSGDHVGFVYLAVRPLVEWSSQVGGATVLGIEPGGAMAELVPDWAAFALRVEGDGLVMESLAPETAAGAPGESRASKVAEHVPAGAIALSISNDYGKGILAMLNTYRADPSLKSTVETIDQALGVLGGADAAASWIGDLGIAVVRTDTGVEGGIVIAPTDSAAATRLFTSLRTMVALGGSAAGIDVRDESYAGTTITIIDLGDLEGLAALGGVSPDMLGAGGLPTGHIELAYAITDQVVVIGAGPGFVKHVLDTTADTSIASNDRYKSLVGRAGQGSGSGFLDITAIRELIEPAMASMGGADLADYEQNVKPFLVPLDAVVASNSVKDGVVRSRVIVTVK